MLSKSLSSYDIYNLFDNNIRILKYNDLYNYEDIEDVFGAYEIVFILYEERKNIGHWVVLCYDRNNDVIIFFDPYGIFPDDQLEYSNKKYNGYYPILSELLINFEGKVMYNKYPLQDIKNKDVSTCGRWCSLFALLFPYMSINEFANSFLDSGIYPDDIITALTDYV